MGMALPPAEAQEAAASVAAFAQYLVVCCRRLAGRTGAEERYLQEYFYQFLLFFHHRDIHRHLHFASCEPLLCGWCGKAVVGAVGRVVGRRHGPAMGAGAGKGEREVQPPAGAAGFASLLRSQGNVGPFLQFFLFLPMPCYETVLVAHPWGCGMSGDRAGGFLHTPFSRLGSEAARARRPQLPFPLSWKYKGKNILGFRKVALFFPHL